jgi:phage virion morphogenesis protein
MAGVALHIDLSRLKLIQRRLDALGKFDRPALLDVVGNQVEAQTRVRLSEEKHAPDGAAWPDWSPEYAATRHGDQSLLEGEGDLLGSIDHVVTGDEVEIGSNLIYARPHQEGADFSIVRNKAHVRIPARPYLGLSDKNEAELERTIVDWFEEIMA